MRHILFKYTYYLIAGLLVSIGVYTSKGQNLQLINKKCPGNWAFFIGEMHHIDEINEYLINLITVTSAEKLPTVIFMEYPKSFNYWCELYLKSGKACDLKKLSHGLIEDRMVDTFEAIKVRNKYEAFFETIYKLNGLKNNGILKVEFIDKEKSDSITLCLLEEQFNIKTRLTKLNTVFDSVFYFKRLKFGKAIADQRLKTWMEENANFIKKQYSEMGYLELMRCFRELNLRVNGSEIFSKKSIRDSLMCDNFMVAIQKYKNHNYILQFGGDHVFKGKNVYNYKSPKRNFYKRVLEANSDSSLCLSNAIYFCKQGMPVSPTHIGQKEADFLKTIESGKMIENKQYPELQELSKQFDYTIVLEKATLLFEYENPYKKK